MDLTKVAAEDFCFVSGANAPFFVMAGILAECLSERFPDVPFRLLDFGLTPPQCAFAAAKGWLIPSPADVAPRDHPYSMKAAMGKYVSGVDVKSLVWLDSDIIPLGGSRSDLERVIREMDACGQVVGACADQGVQSIGEFLNRFPSPALENATTASDRLEPYFNVGFVVFRDRDFLGKWPQLAARHRAANDICFEQNAFNLWAISNRSRVALLDAGTWNVHGRLLQELVVTQSGVRCGGRPAIMLHATSPEFSQHVQTTFTLMVNGMEIGGTFKWFRDERLRRVQEEHLTSFVRKNFVELCHHGIMVPEKLAEIEPGRL